MGVPFFTGPLFSGFFIPGYQLIDGDALNLLFGLTVPIQRAVTLASQVQILSSDVMLNMNLSQSFVWQLPKSAGRNGKPLLFIDAGLKCTAFPQTLQPFGTETIVNWTPPTSLVMNVNGQVVGIHPFNDGVNSGWFLP